MSNLFQMAMQMRNNPSKFFGNMQGVNINDPNAIIQHMMNSGQITQEQYNNAVNKARQMGFIK